jgi:hypothetical protein
MIGPRVPLSTPRRENTPELPNAFVRRCRAKDCDHAESAEPRLFGRFPRTKGGREGSIPAGLAERALKRRARGDPRTGAAARA